MTTGGREFMGFIRTIHTLDLTDRCQVNAKTKAYNLNETE